VKTMRKITAPKEKRTPSDIYFSRPARMKAPKLKMDGTQTPT
jgi:hypothetical protein